MLDNDYHYLAGIVHVQELIPELGEDTKTTSTAVYAAVAANISALFALVKTPTLTAKRTVNMAITPSCAFAWSRRRNKTTAPISRIAARTVLTMAATQATWLSWMCSVSCVIFVVLDR